MKATDLDILLQEGEGVMPEYKEGLSASLARELVAFANTAGGRILLGVRDDGTVKGISDTNELRARIQDIARNCDPPVKILLQRVGANVFVEIYDDRIEVSSPGGLPKGMLPEDLGSKSVRRNPLIADLLHRIAFIENAGTGIRRMRDGAREQGCPEPEFSADGFFIAVFRPIPAVSEQSTPQVTPQVGTKKGLSRDQVRILKECLSDSAITELLALAGRTNRTKFRDQVINPLIDAGLIEMTIPGKPRSPKQRYRITSAGRDILQKSGKELQS